MADGETKEKIGRQTSSGQVKNVIIEEEVADAEEDEEQEEVEEEEIEETEEIGLEEEVEMLAEDQTEEGYLVEEG
jgi:hypothetical protein